MISQPIDNVRQQLIEKLASLEHDRWAHWQRYLHNKGTRLPDGSLHLPADLVSRWEHQISAGYEDLSEEEKDSDREQVMKLLDLLERWLAIGRKER